MYTLRVRPVMRVLAGILACMALFTAVAAVLNLISRPDWVEGAGLLLAVVLGGYTVFTGRSPKA